MYGALKAEILCESTFSERSHNAQYNINYVFTMWMDSFPT